jgi:hypothetical protein
MSLLPLLLHLKTLLRITSLVQCQLLCAVNAGYCRGTLRCGHFDGILLLRSLLLLVDVHHYGVRDACVDHHLMMDELLDLVVVVVTVEQTLN